MNGRGWTMQRARRLLLTVALALGAALAAGPARPARAADVAVGCSADALATAVYNANRDSAPDTLVLDPGCTYDLRSLTVPYSLPWIMSPITIEGRGATVSFSGWTKWIIHSSGNLTIHDLTSRGAYNAGPGGAVYNMGALTVRESAFLNNTATAAYDSDIGAGGAIFNTGTLIVGHSTFTGNVSRYGGGAILNLGHAELTDTTFTGNNAFYGGGGAIRNRLGGTAVITSSTFTGNTSAGGGAVSNSGTIDLRNSTFFNNSTQGSPGTLDNDGTASLTAVTISGSGAAYDGSVVRSTGGTLTVRQSIIASNVTGSACVGAITDLGGNLHYPDATCPGALADPRLGPLADNGGATQTLALLPGSPALDAIPASQCALGTDQRGVLRPYGAGCDIGAYEHEPLPHAEPLDLFARADGSLGQDWSGPEGLGGYQIIGEQLEVVGGGPVYWARAPFGASQEVFVTLAQIDAGGQEQNLLLKVQGDQPDWRQGLIEVRYDPQAGAVLVETYNPLAAAWTRYPDIPAALRDGDELRARVYASGLVQVYRNGALLGARSLSQSDAAFFNSRGGAIGLWYISASGALLDSFGGGTLAP